MTAPHRGENHIFRNFVAVTGLALALTAALATTAGREAMAADGGTLMDFLSRRPHVAKDSMDAMPAIDETGPSFADALTAYLEVPLATSQPEFSPASLEPLRDGRR